MKRAAARPRSGRSDNASASPEPLRELLGARRCWALLALLAAVVVWTEAGDSLANAPEWLDVALAAFVLMPVTLAVTWLALPLARARGLLIAVAGLLLIAVAFELAGLDGLFNVAKLLAFTLFGYWFVQLFQELWSIVLVALLIPWVDALSVWAGPTRVVVEERPDIFERISLAFPLPGGNSSANLGPPDVIFLALFLATAARYELRVAATFLCSAALLALTLVLAVALDLGGLPALPAVALGFLAPNADLLWRAWRERPAGRQHARPAEPE